MTYKVLSVKQPHAAFICHGIKDIENRTWKTDYRGKLLIHASGAAFDYPPFNYLPKKLQEEFIKIADNDDWKNSSLAIWNYSELLRTAYEFYEQDWNIQELPDKWIKEAVKKHGHFLTSQAIVGEVMLVDIYDNLYDANSEFAEPGCYYWKLADPILYEEKEIIRNVLGHLRLWNFESDKIEKYEINIV